LSAIYVLAIARALDHMRDGLRPVPNGDPKPAWRPPRRARIVSRQMLRLAGGRARITRAMEPA
jgi:hypothetical protein